LIAKNGIHTRRERSLESKETLLNIAFYVYLHPQIMEERKGKQLFLVLILYKGGEIGSII